MNDQPVFEADYVEKRSRLTTFFRYILAIPHLIVLIVWGLIVYLAVIVAWFAIVFTGRYPQGLYDFIAGFTRYASAFNGYFGLLTDDYPPFGAPEGDYPVRLILPPRLEQYSRVKTFFRGILAIIPAIIAYAMSIVSGIGTLISWFAIVIIGKQPKGLQDMIVLGLSYQQRLMPYYLLLTEDWPSFTSPERGGGTLGGGPSGGDLPSSPAHPEAPTTSSQPDPFGRGGSTSGDPLGGA